jgi:hypothetical protein
MPPLTTGIGEGWKEHDWDKLLINIEAGTVIPILGRDLLYVAPDEATPPVPLYRFIATRLVEELVRQFPALPAGDPSGYTLNDAVCLCLRYGRNQFDICYSILEVLKEVSTWPAPATLRQLAEITDFRLFVSTTFDPLIEAAVKTVKNKGEHRQPIVLSYDPKPPSGKAVEDLPVSSLKTMTQPFIYHLMGRLALSSSNVVISDEDLLEFVAALYSENKKRVPINLLNEFSRNHLLLLGCSFSDWLARFFLRAAKRRRLSAKPDDERLRNIVEYVVDDYAPQEKNLVLFLEQFWTSTRIFRSGNVVQFVEELRRRWGERNPAKLAEAADSGGAKVEPAEPLPSTMPDGAIFISYAREDIAAAERLHAKLKGMVVWFDQARLHAGDAWEHKIDDSIARCRFFMPIISRTTDRRLEGFFRREWNQAADRTRGMHDSTRFILPVVIDDTKAGTARVPKAFLRTHWWTLPEGKATPTFVQEMRVLIEGGNGDS